MIKKIGKAKRKKMNRKIRLSLLVFISFLLLVLCIHFRLDARCILGIGPAAGSSLTDPWREEIFSGREFSNLVVSIQGDEDDLYSEKNGLMTSSDISQGRDGERPICIFIYDKDGNPLIAQKAGIRISGATSRSAIRKSFRIVARKEYDKTAPRFTYDLWEGRRTLDGADQEICEYSSFILHSMRLAMDSTGIHNSVGYSLAKKAGFIDASPTIPAAVYVNGVYQGAYFILPAKNNTALAELYNIRDPKDIEVVSVFEEEKTGIQTAPEVLEEYMDFVNFVQISDMNDPEVITELESRVDVYQCLQYYAVNLLLGNGDWIDNNLRVWRCKDNGLPYQDGKWRYFLFDLDWIGSFPDLVSMNFQQATQSSEQYNILPYLLNNPDYLALFKDIVAQMEKDAFNPETIEAVFAEEDARMLPEVSYDFQSEAFYTYIQYSVSSDPPEEDEYLTLQDRQYLVEDFKAHLLKTSDIINECFRVYYP